MGLLNKARHKSPWIVHYDCTSCNGCDIEVLAALTPVYDAERFGVLNIGNPKHADVLVVTGSVNHRNVRVLRNIYLQMPSPKAVLAIGACACTGGIFAEAYNVLGGVDKAIPVDVYLPGCSVRPEAVLDGVLKAAAALTDKDAQKRHMEFSKKLEQDLCQEHSIENEEEPITERQEVKHDK
jgi:Ni,Fe-hydrogenase III small subunit